MFYAAGIDCRLDLHGVTLTLRGNKYSNVSPALATKAPLEKVVILIRLIVVVFQSHVPNLYISFLFYVFICPSYDFVSSTGKQRAIE